MNELLATPSYTGGELPTGMIMPFAGNIELDGWSVCDGGELSRTKYKNLFNVIGTTYGEGDGSTTFNKPNFIGKTIWGDTTAGVEKQAGLPNIEGEINILWEGHGKNYKVPENITESGAFSSIASDDCKDGFLNAGNIVPYIFPRHTKFDASKSNATYGNSQTVQPPAITVRMMIKL